MAFFNSCYDEINKAIMGFMHTTSDGLITYLGPLLVTGLTIYFICKAWSIMYGTSQDSLKQVTMQVIKMAFVSTMFLSTAHFYTDIAEPFYKLDETFIPMLSKSFDDPPENSFDAIDKLYDQLLSIAGSKITTAFDAANKYTVPVNLTITVVETHTIQSYVNAFIFATCVGIMILSTVFASFAAFVLLITNTLGLCFVLAFGPLFGSFLLFPQTKDLFNSWLKQCMGFVLTKIFITAALILMVQIITSALGLGGSEGSISTSSALQSADWGDRKLTLYIQGKMSDTLTLGLKFILIALLIAMFGYFLKLCPEMAKGIVGSGISMGGGGAVNAANAAGGAAAKAAKAATAGTAGTVSGAVGKGVGKLAQTAQKHGMNRTARVMNAIGSKMDAIGSKLSSTPSKN
ncbi:MAG: type IV secretion system protein [Succinivibrionaceae bacterium]|nr:type IV secretion system protein [Succinivibrionaceae bacterium]